MSREEALALRVLANAATPGPWEAIAETHRMRPAFYVSAPGELPVVRDRVASGCLAENAAFIAACRESVPALVHAYLRLLNAVEQTILMED